MIIYQATNDNGTETFERLRMAKEHIRAQELPGYVDRVVVDFTKENFFLALDMKGGWANDIEKVWEY